MRDSEKSMFQAEKIQQKFDDIRYVESHIGECPDLILVGSPHGKKAHWIELRCGERIKNPIIIDNRTLIGSNGKKYELCEKCSGILAGKIHFRRNKTGEEPLVIV